MFMGSQCCPQLPFDTFTKSGTVTLSLPFYLAYTSVDCREDEGNAFVEEPSLG